jgi:hypothetical protein
VFKTTKQIWMKCVTRKKDAVYREIGCSIRIGFFSFQKKNYVNVPKYTIRVCKKSSIIMKWQLDYWKKISCHTKSLTSLWRSGLIHYQWWRQRGVIRHFNAITCHCSYYDVIGSTSGLNMKKKFITLQFIFL